MVPDRTERRLAAVLAADMVGYSRLMEADEEGTIERHKSHRRDLIDPTIAAHNGRIVKSTGDGLLVEFSSVFEAVRCAIAIQSAIAEYEADVSTEERINYRIGINLGDIVIDGDEIYGDGVNIAVRLEGLADPGGVCISGSVHSEIQGKIDIKFTDGNEYVLKNISRAVQVWRWAEGVRTKRRRENHHADSAHRGKRGRIENIINLRPLDVGDTFKGREREIETLSTYIADPSVRMVSILGRGGMGKTALATRVLADLECGQSGGLAIDGILYLAARSMPITLERIYADIGRMFDKEIASDLALRWGNPVMSLRAKADYLIEVMAGGNYVILLDNLEDELQADSTIANEGLRVFVEQCLLEPNGIRLVVTSRQKVGVPPAALRVTRTISLETGLSQWEAIALLKDLDPQGTLGIRNAPEGLLNRAIQLTGGIPRALELLSGLLYEDPTTDFATLLSDPDLFGEEIMTPLVANGYNHLKDRERRIMEALAVFNDHVDETAIVSLTQPWMTASDVHVSLRRLINGHFVKFNSDTRTFSLHQLDRDYAYDQIPEAP